MVMVVVVVVFMVVVVVAAVVVVVVVVVVGWCAIGIRGGFGLRWGVGWVRVRTHSTLHTAHYSLL